MIKQCSFISGLFLYGASAFANPALPPADQATIERDVATQVQTYDDTFDGTDHGGKRGKLNARARKACREVNLTTEQKEEIREALFQYRKSQIQARAELRIARLEFARALANSEAGQESAVSLVQTLVQKRAAVAKNRAELKMKIFFTILEPEQRKNAYICMKGLERARKHRRSEIGESLRERAKERGERRGEYEEHEESEESGEE